MPLSIEDLLRQFRGGGVPTGMAPPGGTLNQIPSAPMANPFPVAQLGPYSKLAFSMAGPGPGLLAPPPPGPPPKGPPQTEQPIKDFKVMPYGTPGIQMIRPPMRGGGYMGRRRGGLLA